ncbi:MAG: hypothetical protein U0271_15720 [Polyangiaceae bacterium]
MRVVSVRGWFAGLAVSMMMFGAGCASAGPDGADDPSKAERDPVELGEVRITKTDPAELDAIFEAATQKLLRDDYAGAAEGFDRVAAVEPNGKYAVASLYNAGLAYLGLEKLDLALERFHASIERGPTAETTKTAWLRISRVDAYLERWPALESDAKVVVARTDLTPLEKIEGLGAMGLALVEQGKTDEAFTVLARARNEMEDRGLGQVGTPPREIAQVMYALGEVRRVQGELIVFEPYPPNFAATLEERCTALLSAQDAYSETMRSMDAHWSAMAGFRIGQLYQRLHDDVMKIPTPASATTVKQKQLWEGALRLRSRVLLETGLKMMDATVAMGERTGSTSPWVSRARAAKTDLEAQLATEKEALSKLPYTEDELREALGGMKTKTQTSPPPNPP